jgi:hypothetical protein
MKLEVRNEILFSFVFLRNIFHFSGKLAGEYGEVGQSNY